ncbi:MAG: alpha/beta hydrolase [Anaerolineaceae bacterium]|nr:MAG: alpha/beta hydrolase [Anaerolineaceae bacterium]
MPDERVFFQRTQEMMACYERGDYAGALAVTGRLAAEFPNQSARTDFWRICLLSRLQKVDEALRVLQAALDGGMWWAEPTLRSDPDLAPLHGLPEFERMTAVCRERHAAAQAVSKPALVVCEPAEAVKPYPLLIALHPMSSTAEASLSYWETACAQGWLVAAVQSSQLAWPGAYAWTDRDKGQEEVVGQFASLCEQYPVDLSRVIVGGMSQGGALAIRLALNGSLPARGFLAVVPGLIERKLLEEWAGTARDHPVRGYLVAGGRDPRREFFGQVCEILPTFGIPCRMEDHPELGHEFPPDFEQSLEKALSFLSS